MPGGSAENSEPECQSEARFAAVWTIGKSFDQNSKARGKRHGDQHHHGSRCQRLAEGGFDPSIVGDVIAHERAEHVHVAVGKIDQPQDAIDHRVAQRDERVRAALGDTVDDLLEKCCHERAIDPP